MPADLPSRRASDDHVRPGWDIPAASASDSFGITLIERDITFDLTQRFITDGSAVALVGRSTAAGLPQGLRWIALADPIMIMIALVLPAGELPATACRFARIALAHATGHHWLD